MASLRMAFDMRAPDFGAPSRQLYQAALSQCEWADRVGFDSVSFMEHHASSDGYLPSPIVMASAAAARTSRIQIGLSVMLLPLYHPLRAAEDIAVLDIISGGRIRLTVGAGYREEEYAQFGLNIRQRPSLMTKGIETLRKSWTGEAFEFEGRQVRILPRPAQPGGPEIVMGGASEAAAKRAARIADGFAPIDPGLFECYRQELKVLGKPVPDPMPTRESSPVFIHVSNDPDKDWSIIAPHALHESNDYASWAKGDPRYPFKPSTDADVLRASGMYLVLTPDECIEQVRKSGELYLRPLMGGLDPDIANQSLSLIENSVLPALRE